MHSNPFRSTDANILRRPQTICWAGGAGLFLLLASILLMAGTAWYLTIPIAAMIVALDALIVWTAIQGLETAIERERDAVVSTGIKFAHRLALAIEMRDPCKPGHNDRVGKYCRVIAESMGKDAKFCERIEYAAPFHDVGKICIPDELLAKPGALTEEERDIVERHVELGATILEDSDDPIIQMACSIVSTHHENWDGSGYPLGLTGDEIPIEGRIVAAADVFDALLSARTYKDPWPVGRAIEEMRRQRGVSFDPTVLDALESCVHRLISVGREVPAEGRQLKKVRDSHRRVVDRVLANRETTL